MLAQTLERSSPLKLSGRLMFMALILATSIEIYAEPLGYVNRPDRDDVAIFDTASKSVLAGVPLGSKPYTVKSSPDGSFAYVGLNHAPMMVIKSLDASLHNLGTNQDPKSSSEAPVDVTAIAFHPSENMAYAAGQSGSLFVIDTTSHSVVDIWYLESSALILELQIDTQNNLLVARDAESKLLGWELSGGQPVPIPIVLNEILSMKIGPQGQWYFLEIDELSRLQVQYNKLEFPRPSQFLVNGASNIPIQDISEEAGNFDFPLQFEISLIEKTLFLGFRRGVVALQCFDLASNPETLVDTRNYFNCFDWSMSSNVGAHRQLTAIDLTNLPDQRGLEGEMADLQYNSIHSEIYVIGRRVVAAIDTETLELTKIFKLRAGRGFLGNLSIANNSAPCTSRSNSIASLENQVRSLNTNADSVKLLTGKLKVAKRKIVDGNIISGRYALKAFIDVAVWRSNLPPSDPRHVEPESAADVICAAGNMLSRLDAF